MQLTGRIQNDLQGFRQSMPQPYKLPRTWVMVIDQHIARIFTRQGYELEPIGTALPDEHPQDRAEISNKSVGRIISSSAKSIHHKYEPRMNESRQQNMAFAAQISHWLDNAVRQDAFDRLVLVAAPKILGELRKMASLPVQERIFAELNKDLTKFDLRALEEELEETVFS